MISFCSNLKFKSYSWTASVIPEHLSLLISCQFHFLVNEIVPTLLFWVPQIPLLWKHVKIINRLVCFVDCACTMLSLTFHKISKSCASISWWQYKLASLCFLLFVFISSISNSIMLILLLQKMLCWKFLLGAAQHISIYKHLKSSLKIKAFWATFSVILQFCNTTCKRHRGRDAGANL